MRTHISAALYSCCTTVSHREVNGEGVHLPPFFLLFNFIHHNQHSAFFLCLSLSALSLVHYPSSPLLCFCHAVSLTHCFSSFSPIYHDFCLSFPKPPEVTKKKNCKKWTLGHQPVITSFCCVHARQSKAYSCCECKILISYVRSYLHVLCHLVCGVHTISAIYKNVQIYKLTPPLCKKDHEVCSAQFWNMISFSVTFTSA